MAIMELKTSTALVCDTEGCHQSVLTENAQDCLDDAALIGWRMGTPNGPYHCPECAAGHLPAAAARAAVQAHTGPIMVVVPMAVQKGADVFAENGSLVGTAKSDKAAGEMVEVELCPEMLRDMTGLKIRDDDAGTHADSVMAVAEASPFIQGDSDGRVRKEPALAEDEQPPSAKEEAAARQAILQAQAEAVADGGNAEELEDVDDLFGKTTWNPDD